MQRGYIDSNRLNDNKILSLESIKTLSIDKIIDLYREGYRLENTIVGMAVSPSFKYIVATKTTTDILFQVLVENNGTRGLVRLKTYNKTTGTCVEDTAMQNDWCVEASTNLYISSLWSLINTYKSSGTLFNTGCLRAFTCSSGENCDTLTCSAWSTSPIAVDDNISVGGSLGVTPTAVNNYSLTSGNNSITATWATPTNTPIFAYQITLKRTSDSVILAQGWVTRNNVVISNLVNGTQYSVLVRAVSDDGLPGPTSTLNATPVAPTLATITISPTTAAINIGQTQQFTAVCKDSSNNTMTCPMLTCASSNTSVATVNTTGLVTGVAVGTTNITASAAGITSNVAIVTVSVPTPVLTTITISPTTATITVGQTQQFAAACKDQFGSTMTCPMLTWESSDPTKATISNTGLLTGASAGSTNVTAKSGTIISNTAAVTISAPVLTTIEVSPSSKTLSPGGIQTFTAICKDQNGTAMSCPTITWSVDNTSVGTITSGGVFTAGTAGSTTVRATSDTKFGTATITVTTTIPVLTTITISPTAAYVAPGGTKTFTATPKDQFGGVMTEIAITWSVVDTTKGTVSPTTGLSTTFTGATEGTTTIKATSGAIVGIATIAVTTAPPAMEGGTIIIAAIALIGAAIFIARRRSLPKPPKE